MVTYKSNNNGKCYLRFYLLVPGKAIKRVRPAESMDETPDFQTGEFPDRMASEQPPRWNDDNNQGKLAVDLLVGGTWPSG
jgi:hypothetical protein